ncbi:DNA-binding domain-containing protein [Dyella psychrodurans]|uniref:DUF2063 domain-containing protein n=1 Tax=Dyella psychrodurans TaxID=1927960 RepID=A0A370X4L1_9GAMM|nr:DNA-binding domain-containing protein [Dyella psychrodurans]RDS83272.1 DUF2063 domain-containing protein [Dyella psychrodurans]
MSTLQTIQQQMLQAVLAERTLPPHIVLGDDIADASSRLDVYRHGYRIRLRDALKVEFAGLQCMAGSRFEGMLDKYVEAHPSEHYNIRWYGSGLAGFLEYAHPWREKPQLANMAKMDWAISTAFDAADESSMGVADLSAVPPESWAGLRLTLQNNLQVLECAYNTDAFRRATDNGSKRPHLRRFAQPRQVLVWRRATTVHYRRLDDDEWLVLGASIQGETFASLCARLAACHGESAAMPRMVTVLKRWLEAGLIRGWDLA